MRRTAALLLLLVTAGCTGALDAETTRSDRVDVQVVEVVDGDTFEVRFPDGSTDTVRLIGVDTPETHADVSPSEYEGVPDTPAGRDCLREWGERASEFAHRQLADRQVTLVFDDESPRRGGYGRLLAHVSVDGTDFERELLEEGYARLYDAEFERLDEYRRAEDDARADDTGLWTCRTPYSTAAATSSTG